MISFIFFMFITGLYAQVDIERYLFNQCECRGRIFESESLGDDPTGNNFETSAVIGEGYDCSTDAVRGFTRLAGNVATGVEGSLSPDFFNNAGFRSGWYAIIDVVPDLPSVFNVRVEIVNINLEGAQFSVDAVFPSADFISFELNGGDQIISKSFTLGATERVLIGEATVSGQSRFFMCAGGQCRTSNNPISTDPVGDIIVVELLNGNTDFSADVRIETIAFVEDNTNLNVVIESQLQDALPALESAVALDISALPAFNDIAKVVLEDSNANAIDVNDYLEGPAVALNFVLDFNGLDGTASGANGATFQYAPLADAFGEDNFSFTYSAQDANVIPYVCELKVDKAPIEITPVTDAPVIITIDPLQAFAFVETEYAVQIANSVDFGDNILLDGSVVVTELPDPTIGVLNIGGGNCDQPIQVEVPVAMVDENFEFCFAGAEGGVVGSSADFTYSVLPQDGDETLPSEEGTITLLGGNPANSQPDLIDRRLLTAEDVPSTVTVESMVFIPDGVDVTFKVTIASLPDPLVGVINLNGVPIVAGDDLLSTDSFQFVPTPNFFNSNAEGGPQNEDNVDIANTDCPEEEQVDGVCPDVFQYFVTFGVDANGADGVAGEPADFGLFVRAQDDFGFAVDSSAQDVVVVSQDDEDDNGFIEAFVQNLEFSSDENSNVFEVTLRVEGLGGVRTDINAGFNNPPQLSGFTDVDKTVISSTSCVGDVCAVVDMTGTPFQINAFFKTVIFLVPSEEEEGAPPSLIFSFSDEADALIPNLIEKVEFEVEPKSPLFFDDPQNVGLVAAGGGCCLLVVIVVIIVKVTAVNSYADGQKVTKIDPVAPRKFEARGAKKGVKTKRSFEEEDEETPAKVDGGDWEKHFDPETNEPFYHNEKTGETVWDKPTSI